MCYQDWQFCLTGTPYGNIKILNLFGLQNVFDGTKDLCGLGKALYPLPVYQLVYHVVVQSPFKPLNQLLLNLRIRIL